MSRRLICLTSFAIMLSLGAQGWSQATAPSPADGAVLESTWASLSWRSGEIAVSHDIYLGEDYDDVENGTGGTFRGNQRSSNFIVGFTGFPYPNGLVPGTTYYWRIDEVNDLLPGSPFKGDVWNFSVPPRTAYDPDPPDGAGFVAPDVILTWTSGFGAKLHTVYFGDNYDEVNNGVVGAPHGSPNYDPGPLEVGKTYYWRVDEFDARTTYKGDVWSFTVGAEGPGGPVGGTIYVDAVNGDDGNNGSAPNSALATIRKGIETAADGEIVLVCPGLYEEEVDFLGKALVVQGIAASGAGVPVIRNPGDFAVSFYNGEGPDSILQNFIISDSFMGIFITGSSPTIRNVTIAGNTYGIEAYTGSEPDITNSILWYNTESDLFGCQARYSCVERGGEADITLDPLFADAENGDYHLRSERGRYWPEHDIWVLDTVTSPCVDAGDPEADASGEPLPNGGRVNVGAYGGTLEASLSPGEQPCPQPEPGKASNPSPADGTVDVENPVRLTWTAGLNAVTHTVYLGDSLDQVVQANVDNRPHGVQIRSSEALLEFNVGFLESDTIYYWRVDEVGSDGTIVTGEIWTFATGPSAGPPPKGRTCFPADTPVWADGSLVKISNVVSGQTIGGFGCDLPGLSPERIEQVEAHDGTFECRNIVLQTGNRISVVDAHCFMLESGRWIAAQNLTCGLRLKTLRGTVGIRSVTIRATPYVGKVYNLKIENSQQYMVGKDAVIVRDY